MSGDTWTKQIKDLLSNIGFYNLWNSENIRPAQIGVFPIQSSSKLVTYFKIKSTFACESYLVNVKNLIHRITLTKFKCFAHDLEIEKIGYLR